MNHGKPSRSEVLTANGVCREYHCSRDLVRRDIESGRLAASRMGGRRYSILRADAEAWHRSYRVNDPPREKAVADRTKERIARRLREVRERAARRPGVAET